MKRAGVIVRPGSQRSGWVKVIGMAHRVGQTDGGLFVPQGPGRSIDEAAMELRHALRELSPQGFADVAASTLLMTEGFLKVASAFCNAAGARRATFAPALVACARALDDLMDELRTAEAGRMHYAERD